MPYKIPSRPNLPASPLRRRALTLALALAAPATGRAADPTPVTLSVPGPGGVSYPLQLAARLGLDKAEGIALRLRFVDGGGIAIQDLLTGNSEFAVFGVPAAMSHNLKRPNTPVGAIAPVDDLPLYTLMVRTALRQQVRKVTELAGRIIGVHSYSLSARTTSHQVLDLVMRSHGLTSDRFNFVAVGQNWETQSAAFLAGTVDASMCDEPLATRLAAENLAYPVFSTGTPKDAAATPGAGFLRASLIARRDLIERRGELSGRMVGVVRRALAWMAANTPEQAANLLGLQDREHASFVAVGKRFPRQYNADGRFSTAQLRETETFFRAGNTDEKAALLSLDSMVIDRWAGRKP